MNYIGCKYSLLPFLDECIHKVVGEHSETQVFCDIFAGTGTVGAYFKKKGYSVISNDLQYYSYVLGRQYIGNHRPILFNGLAYIIPEISEQPDWRKRMNIVCSFLNEIPGTEGFVFNNYCKGGVLIASVYTLLMTTVRNAMQ